MSKRTHVVRAAAAAKRGQRAVVLLALGAMLSLTAACGESAGGSGGTTAPEVVEEAKAAVAENRQGTDRELPASAPKPQADMNVWVISCSQAAEGCSQPAAGAEEAAEVIGWQMTVFDGKGSPDVFAEGIRSAIADNADAIILDAIDCVAVKSALQEAREAGVKIYGIFSMDCDDPFVGGEPLFDAQLTYEGGMNLGEYFEGPFIRSLADYAIAETDGEAQIIEFTQDDALISQHLNKGFEDRIKDCAGCTIVAEVPITFNDLISGKLQAKAEAALTRYPQADVVYGLYDSALILGISQAVVASGRNDDLLVLGGEGLSPNIGFIRDNKGQDVIIGSPANWLGWAAVDGVNRLLQGEPQVDAGIGFQTLDREGPLPEQTTYYDGNIDEEGNPKVDYRAHYQKIWSGS